MLRSFALALPFVVVLLRPATTLAADDCPDGWFCEDSKAPQSPPPPADERPKPEQRIPPAGRPPAFGPPGYPPPSRSAPAFARPGYPPPPSSGEGFDDAQIYLDAPDNPAPKKRSRRGFREWGFNLHLETALLGNKSAKASNAGMAGAGFGFRYRPLPPVAFEAGIDFLTGTDFQGYSRSEAGLLLNTLLFFNPHDVVQLFALGGFGFSGATVTIAPRGGENFFPGHDEHYSYFGGQLGLGVEVRVTRSIAIAGDVVGFIRGRTDARADTVPEFNDPITHRATNSSGGGLLRLGASFYW